MNAQYYINIVYPAALDDAFATMIEMKRSIEKYKLRENANQKWIDKQETTLARLMYFIETSKETFEALQSEHKKAKLEGFKKGVVQTERKLKHQEEYGSLSFDAPSHKEQIRAASIFNAQHKWNY